MSLFWSSKPQGVRSTEEACAQCPFREGSSMRYDADSLEAVQDDMEPFCHMKVGADAIFQHEPPVHRCVGHDLWAAGKEGYRLPSESKS